MLRFLKKYKAFTLAEILIVFSIIGIISALILMTTKRITTTDKYSYQRAYDSLLTAAYNSIAEFGAREMSSPEILCQGLSKYINSQAATSNLEDEYETAEQRRNNPTDFGFCNRIAANDRVNKDTSNFENLTPDFIANNGMKFYISNSITQNVADLPDDIPNPIDRTTQNIEFYLVYIDIDGGDDGNINEDVFAFAVTKNADVIPLGAPTYDRRHYMGVRVVYPETEAHPDGELSESLSYHEARLKAWGGLGNFEDLRTFDFNSFSALENAAFLNGINPPTTNGITTYAIANENQAHQCMCDNTKKENDDVPDCFENPNNINIVDRFDCDIKVERYH